MSSIAKARSKKIHFIIHIENACIPQYAQLFFSLTLQALRSKLHVYANSQVKCYFYFTYMYLTTIIKLKPL